MADTPPDRVAVYIDFDNIVISRYNQLFGKAAFTRDHARSHTPADADTDDVGRRLADARVQVGSVLDYASSFGSVVISRAYADWSEAVNSAYQRDLVDRAVDLTQMFATTRAMKNGADIRLAVDVVEDLFRLPDLTHIIIVAGDSDYIALAQKAKRLGRYVVGIGVAGATSRALMAACDEFSDYDDLPGVERPRARTEREPVAAAPEEPEEAEEPEVEPAEPDSPAAQQAATELLVRAIRLVEGKRADEDWLTNSEVRNQITRLDPAFTQKPLGYRSFTAFLASRSEVVEVKQDAKPDGRRLRLRPGV